MIPYENIFRYLESIYPNEGCGILINKRGNYLWQPCDNISSNPLETFKISGVDYIKANLKGDIVSVVHSHPNNNINFSEEDKKASDFLKVPYTVVALPSLIMDTYYPSEILNPFSGRTYKEGKSDCWSLVQDYYKETYNIKVPICDHISENWKDLGIPFKEEEINDLGFEYTDKPKKGDLILFNVMSKNPNHFGVYLGGNIFLHHADNRLSCREPIAGVWAKYLKGFLKCKIST